MRYVRLAFEIFHDVEKPVVDIRLVDEANLDLVQVAERVLQVAVSDTRQQETLHGLLMI